MAELLLDSLGTGAHLVEEKEKEGKRSKRKQVTNILEWVKCFGIYVCCV